MESNFKKEVMLLSKRSMILIGTLTGVSSIFLLFSEQFSEIVSRFFGYNSYGSGLTALLLITSAVSFSFVYLQSGGQRVESRGGLNEIDREEIDRTNRLVDELEIRNFEISKRLDYLSRRLEETEATGGLTQDERERVIVGAVEAAGVETIRDIFTKEANRYEGKLKDSLGLDRLVASSRRSVERLSREISDLRLRSNINLLIGMAITGGGLWLLWSTVSMVDASELLKTLASEGRESDVKFLKNLILPIVPRIMLVIFVEVFAYFFLRLYRNGLSEIKFFQNELTNVESKLTAIEFAFVTKSDEALKSAIEALSKTERNFVLEKGQTTVELERAKSDSDITRSIVKNIPKIFKGRSK